MNNSVITGTLLNISVALELSNRLIFNLFHHYTIKLAITPNT